MSQQEHFAYEDEELGLGARILRKAERNPFLIAGLAGFVATLGYGAYRFKYRSKAFPMSLFFIQLRVAAQSVIIGTLTVGMVCGMVNEYVLKDKTKPKVQ